MTIYPHEEEVPRIDYDDSSQYDDDYVLERHVHSQRPLEGPGLNGCCKRAGWWVYVPKKTTPYPPYGHLLNHCKKHCNTKVLYVYMCL